MLRKSEWAETSGEAPRPDWPQWFTRRDASHYLWVEHGVRLSPATLANLAVKSSDADAGPPFHKEGGKNVSYSRSDLDAFARRRVRRVRSTSELRVASHARTGRPEAA